jgi:hypothetical protein
MLKFNNHYLIFLMILIKMLYTINILEIKLINLLIKNMEIIKLIIKYILLRVNLKFIIKNRMYYQRITLKNKIKYQRMIIKTSLNYQIYMKIRILLQNKNKKKMK